MTTATSDIQHEASMDSTKETEFLFRRIAIHLNEDDPTGTFSLTYLTEGAANVVWAIRFSDDSNLSHSDSAAVLRMRKDIPSTVPMLELKRQFEERIAPLFIFDPSLLVPVDLVRLCPGVITELNTQLCELESKKRRGPLRIGVYHPSFEIEPYAMIMPNLGHGKGQIVEFKPKWLVQSPSAPSKAQRCRTCALNAMRRAKGGSGRGDSGFCPFDLLSKDGEILGNALRQIWLKESSLPEFVDAFRFIVQPALRQLQELQRSHGEVGLHDFQNPDGKNFSVAMAIRDCSFLLKVVKPVDEVRLDIPLVKLLDLDLKDTGGGKLAKWAKMETELIEEGWYTTEETMGIRCAMTFQ